MSPESEAPRGGIMKGVGITAAVTGIAVYALSQVKDMITPQVVHVAVIILLLMLSATLAGYAASWTWAQIYKKVWVPDFRNLAPILDDKMSEGEKEAERRASREQIDHWKGRILLHAIGSGLLGEALLGVAAWKLLQELQALPPGDWLLIFAIAWGLWGVLVAGSSPYAWKLVFERIFPKAAGEYYAQVGADGRVGLKSAEHPEQPTIYGHGLARAEDKTVPGPAKGEDTH